MSIQATDGVRVITVESNDQAVNVFRAQEAAEDAEISASNAGTSETNAAASALAASESETNAAASEAGAQVLYDDFTAAAAKWSYNNRGGFVLDFANHTWANGDVVTAGGVAYVYQSGATAIADLPNFVPFGRLTPYHWQENNTPGTTVMDYGIESAATYLDTTFTSADMTGGGEIALTGKNVINQANIVGNNISLCGDGRQTTQIIITTLTGNGLVFGDDSRGLGAPRYQNLSVKSLSIVVPDGNERTSGAHVAFLNVEGGGIMDCNINGFYGAVDFCGAVNMFAENLWLTGRGRGTAKALYGLRFREAPVSENRTGSIHVSHIDGQPNNSAPLGWVEDGLLVEAADGLYVKDYHITKPDWNFTINPSGAAFVGKILVSQFFFDRAYKGNARITGNTTSRVRTVMFSNGVMRAAGGEGATIDDTTAPNLLVDIGADGVDTLAVTNVDFSTAQGSAIKTTNNNVDVFRVTGCVFRDSNEANTAALSEVILGGATATLSNSEFTGGHNSGSNVEVLTGNPSALIMGNLATGSNVPTFLTDNGSATTSVDLTNPNRVDVTIADDAVATIPTPNAGGFLSITCQGDAGPVLIGHSGYIFYDIGSGPRIELNTGWAASMSGLMDVQTTDVTGTTGTDGNTTVAAIDGALKIENRSGASRDYEITFM